MKNRRNERSALGTNADGSYMTGRDLLSAVVDAQGHNRLLLSFSCGKDSLAMWLWLRETKQVEIIPYFLYWIPGLSFVEESLAYYEDYFEQRITRLPHPLFYDMLTTFAYQPPQRVHTIAGLELPRFDFADIDTILAEENGLGNDWYCAIGFRSKDGLDRRNMIQQMGVAGVKKRHFYYPVWDWDVNQVAEIINRHGVKLPDDYRYWGRTLAAYDYQYISLMRKHFPDDYIRILDWFPLIEAEFFRYEVLNGGK